MACACILEYFMMVLTQALKVYIIYGYDCKHACHGFGAFHSTSGKTRSLQSCAVVAHAVLVNNIPHLNNSLVEVLNTLCIVEFMYIVCYGILSLPEKTNRCITIVFNSKTKIKLVTI